LYLTIRCLEPTAQWANGFLDKALPEGDILSGGADCHGARKGRSGGMRRGSLVLIAAMLSGSVAAVAALGSTNGHPVGSAARVVVVKPGQRVEIAFAAVPASPFDVYTAGIRRAIAMAVAMHPTVHGFPVKVNTVDTLCGNGVDNTGPANAIVANAQNVAVIGHLCSTGMTTALPIYEAAGVVTLSGSATSDALPALGPTVFNRVIVRDGDGGDAWFNQIEALASVGLWNQYQAAFPAATPSTPFDVFYFDATALLLDRLQAVSRLGDGSLVIDRKALARAVRLTQDFPGVTCTISLDRLTGNRTNDPAALARCAS
jgi:ABC-type branched-subunit amino acid transport system substrate-binding protein